MALSDHVTTAKYGPMVVERGPFCGQHVVEKVVVAVADISDPEGGKT